MDANIVLGWTLLALALLAGSFLAAIILAASAESEPREGTPLYGRRTHGAFVQSGTGQSPTSGAHCYFDCMSGFHWSSDWGDLCSEACSVSGRLPSG